jgi:hypothetical protein
VTAEGEGQAGADAVITHIILKPFDTNDLITAVRAGLV